ncbi:cyclin-dependent kinase 11B-like [Symsagittifera roscoffensis]|uniref:cyclin-dependent kinase 11B-like n=1 Tax=Symsagittifera roscoffensis TaxID=84072 RepID=UPI00307B90CB
MPKFKSKIEKVDGSSDSNQNSENEVSGLNSSEEDVDFDRPTIKPPDPEGANKRKKDAKRDRGRRKRNLTPERGLQKASKFDYKREKLKSESPSEKRRKPAQNWRNINLYDTKRKDARGDFDSGKMKTDRRYPDDRDRKDRKAYRHHRNEVGRRDKADDRRRLQNDKSHRSDRDKGGHNRKMSESEPSKSAESFTTEDQREAREELKRIERRIAELKRTEMTDADMDDSVASRLDIESRKMELKAATASAASTKASLLIDAEVEDVSASESDRSSSSSTLEQTGTNKASAVTMQNQDTTADESMSSEPDSDDDYEDGRPRLLPAAYTSKFDNLDDGLDSPEKEKKKRKIKSSSKNASQANSPNRSELSASTVSREIKTEVIAPKEILPVPHIKIIQPEKEQPILPVYLPALQGCRSVDEFKHMNKIDEGTYGVVYRAQDLRTNEIVALKRLKMEKEREGFPITSLREINCLLKSQHPNVVPVREIVVGSNMDKIYLVMDYVEHDLKALMETMKQPFLTGEVKTIMMQLLEGVRHLHDNWILHRDLKASNLLFSHKGQLKIGDFGLAREYGSPLKPYTPIVVTLWYRAPELLLGTKLYSKPIDMWSVGCIFGELLTQKPMFAGKSETEQLNQIFKELGTPNEKIWPDWPNLPMVKKIVFTEYPYNNLRNKFGTSLTEKGIALLNGFLTFDPNRRLTAAESLKHEFFRESPKPVDPSQFPTWPAKSEGGVAKDKKLASPKAPEGGDAYNRLVANEDTDFGFQLTNATAGLAKRGSGFTLKF